jgi:hypothetical protein
MSDPDISFAIWDGRGLNSPARRLAVYQAISLANAAMVCIQETNMAVIFDHVVRECLGPSLTIYSSCMRMALVEDPVGLAICTSLDHLPPFRRESVHDACIHRGGSELATITRPLPSPL